MILLSVRAGNRTVKELQSFALDTFPDIVNRVSGNSLNEAFAGTISFPKVVLCTDKEETPKLFRALAASFRNYKMLFWTIHSGDAAAKKAFKVEKVKPAAYKLCSQLRN